MYCPRCKNEIKDSSKYCPKCRYLLNDNELCIDEKYKNKISKLLLIGFIFSFILPPVGLIISIIGVILAYSIKRKTEEQIKNLGMGISGIIFSCFFIIIYTAIIIIFIKNPIDRYDQFIFGKYYCEDLKTPNLIIENNEFKVLNNNTYINIGSYLTHKRKIQNINGNKCIEYGFILNLDDASNLYKLNAEYMVIKRCNNVTTISFDGYKTYNCDKE